MFIILENYQALCGIIMINKQSHWPVHIYKQYSDYSTTQLHTGIQSSLEILQN